jgi:transposase
MATDAKLKSLEKELAAGVRASGSHVMGLRGIGPAGAGARILADVGDVARFPDRNHFASRTGTAPLDASSGQQIRHRLSRAGNRRATLRGAPPARHRPLPDKRAEAPARRGRGGRGPVTPA